MTDPHATHSQAHSSGLPEALLWHGKWQPVYTGWTTWGILLLLALLGRATLRKVPGLLQNLFETILEWLQNMLRPFIGEHGLRYMPLYLCYFLYVCTANLLGLFPLMASPTAKLDTTASLALVTFCATHGLGMARKGVWGYWGHFFHVVDASQERGLVRLIMFPLQYAVLPLIEFVGELARPLSLSMRLFGNIVAKEILLAVLASLVLAFFQTEGGIGKALMSVPLLMRPAILALGVLVSIMQAAVFTGLSAIYISTATAAHEEHTPSHERIHPQEV